MKRGFTLIELLTVIAIMAMMSTIATGAYRTVLRGMEDRGVLSTAAMIVSAAQHRARADRQPTAVLFYNVLLQEPSTVKGKERELRVRGEAVAIRVVGRISRVWSNYLADEFNDLDQDYEEIDASLAGMMISSGKSANDGSVMTFRLYHLTGIGDFKGKNLNYSDVLMNAVVDSKVFQTEQFFFEPPPPDLVLDAASGTDIPAACFAVARKNGVNWQVGDAYAMSFKETVLPEGVVFGDSQSLIPKQASSPVTPVAVMTFDPTAKSEKLRSDQGDSQISISAIRAAVGASVELRKVGTVSDTVKNL